MLALLSMLSSTISLLSREDVKTHTSLLLELFTVVLDYRVTQANVGCTFQIGLLFIHTYFYLQADSVKGWSPRGGGEQVGGTGGLL